jgi:hypothetical protein
MAIPQEEQKRIDVEIVRALILCVPKAWRAARLDAERDVAAGGDVAHRITIESPEGHADVVMPSSELMFGLRQLDLLFNKYGHPWSKVHYTVSQTDDTNWGFESKYEYD